MPKQIRLLYRSPLAPADVELGQTCEVDDDVARDLIRDGAAEPVAPPPADDTDATGAGGAQKPKAKAGGDGG